MNIPAEILERGRALRAPEKAETEQRATEESVKPTEEAENVQGLEAQDVQAESQIETQTTEDTEVGDTQERPSLSLVDLAEANDMTLDEFLDVVQAETNVDGRKEAKPLAELLKGYQLSAASHHRFEEAQKLAGKAQQQEALIQQKVAELDTKLGDAESYLTGELKALERESQSVDWARLQAEEPETYAARRIEFLDRAQNIRAKQQQVTEERSKMFEEQRQQWETQRAEHIAKQQQLLLDAVPAWNDPQTFEKESGGIRGYLQAYGASDKDIEDVSQSSAWLLRALREGYLYSEQAKQTPTKAKQLKKVAKVIKPGAAPDADEIELRKKRKALDDLHASRGERKGLRDPRVLAAARAIGVGRLRGKTQ